MKHRVGRGCAAALAVCLLTAGLFGCGLLDNTEFVLTTGLTDTQLFKVGKKICTLPEAMIYVMDYQEQYESAYGVEMWEHDFGGVTLEEYVKDTIVSELASMEAVTLLAEDYEVTLTEEELSLVEQVAKAYYGALDEAQIAYMDLELSDVEALYFDHVLSKKIYDEITKDVNTEVSDDEARIITVQMIRVDSLESAESVLEKLETGREFSSLASAYSKDSQITYTFGRGEQNPAVEETAFTLEPEEVSGIIETDLGYYLIKCIDNFDREATEENKVALVEKRRDEIFGKVYEELIANTPSEFNTKVWESVHFTDWTGEMPPNFLDLYEQYFGE